MTMSEGEIEKNDTITDRLRYDKERRIICEKRYNNAGQ